ncbi:MAG: hypothetical protein ACK559_00265, partial [bacterium]
LGEREVGAAGGGLVHRRAGAPARPTPDPHARAQHGLAGGPRRRHLGALPHQLPQGPLPAQGAAREGHRERLVAGPGVVREGLGIPLGQAQAQVEVVRGVPKPHRGARASHRLRGLHLPPPEEGLPDGVELLSDLER